MNDRIRFEGVTLTVASVDQSIAFYAGKLGLTLERDVSSAFALLRIGLGTIGLVAVDDARKSTSDASPDQKRAVHVEFSCDDLDGLYEDLKARGVAFHRPPHDEPRERSMTAFDPDGYSLEFAQGRRGHSAIQTFDSANIRARPTVHCPPKVK